MTLRTTIFAGRTAAAVAATATDGTEPGAAASKGSAASVEAFGQIMAQAAQAAQAQRADTGDSRVAQRSASRADARPDDRAEATGTRSRRGARRPAAAARAARPGHTEESLAASAALGAARRVDHTDRSAGGPANPVTGSRTTAKVRTDVTAKVTATGGAGTSAAPVTDAKDVADTPTAVDGVGGTADATAVNGPAPVVGAALAVPASDGEPGLAAMTTTASDATGADLVTPSVDAVGDGTSEDDAGVQATDAPTAPTAAALPASAADEATETTMASGTVVAQGDGPATSIRRPEHRGDPAGPADRAQGAAVGSPSGLPQGPLDPAASTPAGAAATTTDATASTMPSVTAAATTPAPAAQPSAAPTAAASSLVVGVASAGSTGDPAAGQQGDADQGNRNAAVSGTGELGGTGPGVNAGQVSALSSPSVSPAATPGQAEQTAPAARPMPAPHELAGQVARHLGAVRTLSDGTHHTVLHLSPEHLGDLTVTIDVQGAAVQVSMAGQSAAIATLRDGLDELRRQLTEAGLDPGSIALHDNASDPGTAGRDGRREPTDPGFGSDPGRRWSGRTGAGDRTSPDGRDPAPAIRAGDGPAGLDVRI